MRSIVLANQKGGVGKTTTAIHLAHGIAMSGRKVALFDLDPQGNATVALQGLEGGEEAGGALANLMPVCENLWLLPSTGAAPFIEHQPMIEVSKLAGLADSLSGQVDWLVVDSPPRMDEWGWAGLRLCDEVIVPVQAEFFAMHGLSQMLGSLQVAAERIPGKARLRGILATMVGMQDQVASEILEDLRKNLGHQVLSTVILRDGMVVEAASHGRTVFSYSPWSMSALCYAELVKELIDG